MEERNKKKKKHTARNATIGTAAALLLLLGGYLGFGRGAGAGAGILPLEQENGTKPDTVITAAPVETKTEEPSKENKENEKMVISVSENSVKIDGKDVELGSLENELKEVFTDGKQVTLKDDHAIKATYDVVVSCLEKLDIPFDTGD